MAESTSAAAVLRSETAKAKVEDTTDVGMPFWQHTIEDQTIPCSHALCLKWAVWLVGTVPPGEWLCTEHAKAAQIDPAWDAMFDAAPDDVAMDTPSDT